MSEAVQEREKGYRAFISYSHRDDAAAKSLHKRLETYRLPKKLIGQAGERGPIPERLTPIFRDLDELSAADDLTVEIKAALARSATLIVLCSPGAKASKWVNLEIETFRALHGNSRPVLAALIEGEPADAFPPALIADGQEPVAADFRKNRDGKSLALLKLVAGMAGAPLDALVQRDAQRQYRRVMAITGGALTAALAMALLLVVALRAQSEAERQRQEAEGLVEYMLTDLRDKLKGVGRLDVMTAVNERAMKYYGGQGDLDDLPTESLGRRARILHAMGEDDERRGDLNKALAKFSEAHRTTNTAMAKQPDDPDAIFAHAQSEYWVGYSHYLKKNYPIAWSFFLRYRALADQLVARQPDKIEWLRERSYAAGNLCTLASKMHESYLDAVRWCLPSVDSARSVYERSNRNSSALIALINQFAWTADVYRDGGDFAKAYQYRTLQLEHAERGLDTSPTNVDLQEVWVTAQTSMAEALFATQKSGAATHHINKAISIAREVAQRDPTNQFRVRLLERALDVRKTINKESKHGSQNR